MRHQITITALEIDKDDDDFTKFRISILNGITFIYLDFYGYLDVFKKFAQELISFPKTIDDIVLFEIGEDNEKWAYYMCLRVYCYERNGDSAIHIKIDDHRKPPNSNKAEFYIRTVPASLNNFGHLLNTWEPELQKQLTWAAD